MMELKTTANDTFQISEEEAEKIKKLEGGFVELKSGELVNISCIVSISDQEAKPYFMGNPMNESMTRVNVNGEWKQFDQAYRDKIEMRKSTNNKLLK